MTLQLSPRAVATLVVRLCEAQIAGPVGKAAHRHEPAMRRVFLNAVREAQAAVPMEELESALHIPGTGAPLWVLQPVFDMMLEQTEQRYTVPYFKTAAEGGTIANVLGAAMAGGAGASELCVLEETLYHGTTTKAAKAIKEDGFKLSATRGEAGIFATPDKDLALNYAVNKTLNEKSRVPLQNRIVALLEVDPAGFARRTTEYNIVGTHMEWASYADVPASSIRKVRLFRYSDVVVDGKVKHSAKPFKVLKEASLFVGLSHEDLFANLEDTK